MLEIIPYGVNIPYTELFFITDSPFQMVAFIKIKIFDSFNL